MKFIKYSGGNKELNEVFTKDKLYEVLKLEDNHYEVHCDFTGVVFDLDFTDYNHYFSEFTDKKELRNEEIKKACDDLAELLIKKNNDYGDSFSQQYGKYGLVSALIRMDDKMRRLENLNKVGSAEVNESIADTLLDLSGYSLLACVEAMRKSE